MRRLAVVLLSCASCAEAKSTEPPPAVVIVAAPPPAVPEAPKVAEVVVPPAPEREELPPLWTLDAPNVPHLGFFEALQRARIARDHWKKLVPPASDEPARKAWFVQVATIADEASRYYASAFHSADASGPQRVDAIAEAAELDAAIARKLDELGLDKMPDGWRTEPAIRSTFEDVADGPARRWRDESRALAKHCVEVSKSSHLSADAVTRCTVLRSTTGAKLAKGDASPCGCSPGDPLCSASLGGWCKE